MFQPGAVHFLLREGAGHDNIPFIAADLQDQLIAHQRDVELAFFGKTQGQAQHIAGARVVAAFKGGSKELPDSYNRVEKFAEELKTKWKVEFVEDIATLCRKVDGVMIESVDGRQHLEQVKQALASGKPLWQLLGGFGRPLKAYASSGYYRRNYAIDDLAADSKDAYS